MPLPRTRRPAPRRTPRSVVAVTALALLGAGTVAPPAVAAPQQERRTSTQPVIGAPEKGRGGCAEIPAVLPHLEQWPRVQSRVKTNKAIERKVAATVARMSLAEKVGQMTQPEITSITPEEVGQYAIGSVLNGGGAWPDRDKHASAADWLALADAYWQASVSTGQKIPVMWGIDAVHGNNNVFGATVFPHNIGLGAAHDPCLIRDIGEATAEQVRATGQDWAFAPTVAVARDDRWGRAYESFSEDARIQRAYGYEATRGLQGNSAHGPDGEHVIATAKHWIGDGGTEGGKDQGVTTASEDEMRNVHAQGYYGAIAAGTQSVMVSFNSWTNEALGIDEGKLHGSRYAVNGILKEKMGFDGLVVSDWNGIGQVTGCTNASCPQAVNAGIDIVMVPADWKAFIANTIAQVESGEIPMARIDDAVTRILRVKHRAGLMEAPKPSERAFAGQDAALEHRALAREAVRKSLVLLKNEGNALPLKRTAKVLVVGKSADSIQNQTGGWTLSWQGTGNSNADFPTGTSILGGLQEALGEAHVTHSATGEGVDPAAYDAVVAVIGETPYAEGNGDLAKRSLDFSRLHPQDTATLDRVSGKGAPVITVYVGGRPLLMNKELNRSDAFVAAWLPGTEGGGVADVLVGTEHDFTGRLSFSWPKEACQSPLNAGQEGYDPLFPLGHGLTKGQGSDLGSLPEDAPARCGDSGGGSGPATEDLELFVRQDVAPYKAYIGSPDNWGGTEVGNDVNAVVAHTNINVRTTDVNVQQDARKARWTGTGPAQFYLQSEPADLSGWLAAEGALVFDAIVTQKPTARTVLSMHCTWPCFSEVEATSLFSGLPLGAKTTVKVPLSCFDTGALDFEAVNTPFLVYTEGALEAAFANVRWVPGAADDADAVACADLT
ncbi:beta-glucosidase [Kineococcus xinjiangensis]|uniref:Beta-glucosidase n=1 Tax=Kineococcus xinjiangensis TaxID=512762 RepID=A0A2S6IWA2_9ACTN|nr:exo 1,3/1,4-beta-D-glucan glucohydrolase [Kineococcus xinjiangensis]PPK98556.1 beta-glucosidase [Kineococcus xinjiangensis]